MKFKDKNIDEFIEEIKREFFDFKLSIKDYGETLVLDNTKNYPDPLTKIPPLCQRIIISLPDSNYVSIFDCNWSQQVAIHKLVPYFWNGKKDTINDLEETLERVVKKVKRAVERCK